MEKIKLLINNWTESERGKNILIVAIIILTGLGAFELGRLSKENANSGIKILSAPREKYASQTATQSASVIKATNNKPNTALSANVPIPNKSQNSDSVKKNFFASNRGSKYYPLSCSAGKTIKQENRIYFASREEAEKAGYELSKSCR